MKNEALHYAKIGLKIIPIRTNRTGFDEDSAENKKPFEGIGSYNASCNPGQIEGWLRRWPGANIAISTGKINNLVVIDLDVDDEKGENGRDILRAWEDEHGRLPDTLMSITGRGGNHMIYRMTEKYNGYSNAQMKTPDGKEPLGVDIRGEGGYFVASPSIHKNGRAYEWEAGSIAGEDVELSDIADVNETVDAFIRYVYAHTGKVIDNGNGKRFEVPEKIPEGMRTDTLFKATCSMIAKGYHERSVRLAICSENEIRCEPPLEDEKLEKEVFKAFKRGYKASASYMLGGGKNGRKEGFRRTEEGRKCRSFINPIS
ncbi:MAG: bifunctional DNA primase/polymerase [Lachnospiraceae bacterium]|nr:bifunctional DNA primase/polymerase [Lachnospiraceae bacterium]